MATVKWGQTAGTPTYYRVISGSFDSTGKRQSAAFTREPRAGALVWLDLQRGFLHSAWLRLSSRFHSVSRGLLHWGLRAFPPSSNWTVRWGSTVPTGPKLSLSLTCQGATTEFERWVPGIVVLAKLEHIYAHRAIP